MGQDVRNYRKVGTFRGGRRSPDRDTDELRRMRAEVAAEVFTEMAAEWLNLIDVPVRASVTDALRALVRELEGG